MHNICLHDPRITTSVIGFGCGAVLAPVGRRDDRRALHSAYDQGVRYYDGVSCEGPDQEQSIWSQTAEGFHQAGTTRMSDEPEGFVVDSNCRVHGVDDLFAVSGSNFVTSEQANSRFMIVAFVLRLADHLGALNRPREL